MNTIASRIDHTLLKPDCTINQIENICLEAIQYNFYSVCIPPIYVKFVADFLKKSSIKTGTVIGFPLGYSTIQSKLFEIKEAIENGAEEIDMVVNISALKSNNWDYLKNEIQLCSSLTVEKKVVLKVILETGLLNELEIEKCCRFYSQFPIQYLKTSTGFAAISATTESVKIMRRNTPPQIKIKASGGIRNYLFFNQLIEAGADRIGTSSGIIILKESVL